MLVREEGMSLVCDEVSLMCPWAIRWREGQSLGIDLVVSPQKACGSSRTGGHC